MAAQPTATEPARHGGPPVAAILEEHLSELGFLAIQRRKLLFSPDVPLRGLERHERRSEAHLDALVVGGAASAELARAQLADPDAWTLAAALRVWLEIARPSPPALQEALATVPVAALRGVREALRSLAAERVAGLFSESALGSLPRPLRGAAADALGWHGVLGARARAELLQGELDERMAVARQLAHARDASPPDSTWQACLRDPDSGVARRALWSLALREPARALGLAREWASPADPDPVALRVIGLFGHAEDLPRLISGLQREGARAAALFALGDLGSSDALEHLAAWLGSDDETIARAAALAVERLAGPLPQLAELERARDLEPRSPPDGEPAIAAARAALARLPRGARLLRGRPLTWSGEAADEPLESLWRGSLQAPGGARAWLRREVPDGFFEGVDAHVAVPGE